MYVMVFFFLKALLIDFSLTICVYSRVGRRYYERDCFGVEVSYGTKFGNILYLTLERE